MTTDNALMNRKMRVRTEISEADASDPTIESIFTDTKGCSYTEINVNGLTGLQVCTIRPFFYETVLTNSATINYVSRGAEITLSLANGDTCNIPGVNGRPIFVNVTDLTTGAVVNIDLAPGRVPPGLNI